MEYKSLGIALQQECLPIEQVCNYPSMAGFWRRFLAWFIDVLLLGIFGVILANTTSSFWIKIGPYGRIFGLTVILSYFGILNSSFGNGQTIGKRCLKIAVRDRSNNPIGIGLSLIRISILAIPFLLNGWALPLFRFPIAQWFIAFIVFGLGGAILYTMVFNIRTRQGLHDLACGTYVVHLSGKRIQSFPKTARVHLIISGIIAMAAVILITIGSLASSFIFSKADFSSAYKLYEKLQSDDRYFAVSVNNNTQFSTRGNGIHSLKTLQIWVWYKGLPTNEEKHNIMEDISYIALDSVENIDNYDLLIITVNSGFDLGIAYGYVFFGDSEPINVWRQRIKSIKSQ
jgi:uncharacterized RDD family membrane protein YckC